MKQLLKTPIFEVIERDEETPGFRPVSVIAPDWVTIVVERDGMFLRERQFRFGTQSVCEEFPCGMAEIGETPVEAAQRELAEETGFEVSADSFEYAGSCSANPAFMTNRMHYFYVNLDKANYRRVERRLDEHEKIETFWRNKQETVSAITEDQYVSVFMLACVAKLGEIGVL